ncbi:hypothetical protein SLS64_000828 [Diaporthe eres]|uniref:CCHC-type domain-containing protein n=1 Tax=Diaporthe eres TaxID=83184 RepID=A0ABR1P4I6_DIAER
MTDSAAGGPAVEAPDIESMPAVATPPSAGADETTHKRPAEDNDAASPRKKARNDQSEGEVSDGVDEGEVNSDAESKASASTKQAGQTWNSGVTTQLRTSFGSSSKLNAAKPPPKLTPALSEPRPSSPEQLTPEIRKELVAAIQAGVTTTLSPVEEHGRSWKIPAFQANFKGQTWDGIFKSMFDQWSADFVTKNQGNIAEVGLDPFFLKSVYLRTLEESVPGANPMLVSFTQNQLNRNSKRSPLRQVAKGWTDRKRAKREAKELAKEKIEQESKPPPEQPKQPPTRQTRSSARMKETQDSDAGKSASSADRKSSAASSGPSLPDLSLAPPSDLGASQQSPAVAEEDVPMDEDDGDDENVKDWRPSNMNADQTKVGIEASPSLPAEAALEQRRRYFPSVPDDAVFCLTCASYGHNTPDCQETACKFCQQGHFSYSCPSRQRCAKCKQLGHTKASCKEKLAMAAGEGFMECAFCEAQDHQEEQCPEIWETYRPEVGHIKQVRSVPTFCYCCGAEGHFGTDCGLADPKVPPSATWSNAGASLYVDPTSSEEAIAFQNPLPAAQAISAPVIPGRSIKPQSHIIFEDSGDEDNGSQGFLRAPATGPRRPGQIQITSNINFGGSAGPSAQNVGGGQQDPTNSKQRRRQRGQNAPASLPPKPQVAPSAPAAAPQASRKGKKTNKKSGKNSQQQQQQPPLPPGPPPGGRNGWRPPEFQARGGNSARGRGGFSSLSRGGGGRRGGGRN